MLRTGNFSSINLFWLRGRICRRAVTAGLISWAAASVSAGQVRGPSSSTSGTPSDSTAADPASATAGSLAVRPDLVGHVTAGRPTTQATVFIFTAGPKVGTSTFCPSCYADCRKSAQTDAHGDFKIESLDPQLVFRILAVAKGFAPRFISKVDPVNGPVHITLAPVDVTDITPDRSMRGRVIDPEGKPVVGAVVESHGIRRKNDMGTMWGQLPGVDPLAVTDERGEFLLTAREPFQSLDVRVQARTFANKQFSNLSSGAAQHTLTLAEGVSVKGRVMFRGKPLGGVSVGLVSADRTAENFAGNFDIGTDSDGRFAFMNLPPNVDCFIYGLMGTLRDYGAIPISQIHLGGDGTTQDAGDLIVGPSQRLAGRVVCSDGHLVPGVTRLLVSREQAWDSMQVELDEEGRFDVSGIPKETVSLTARVPGYHISAQNPSLDPLNPRLVGRMDEDVTNLVFLLEKGPPPRSQFNPQISESEWPQNQRLRGAEAKADHSSQWLIAGRVHDSLTQNDIRRFRVTLGNTQSAFNRTSWDDRSRAEGTNGSFVAYLSKRYGEPTLKIEAEGYVPRQFPLPPASRTNLDFELSKGTGPRGIVFLPDGKPAEDASLALLCAGDQQINLNAKGEIQSWQQPEAVKFTDADGSFSLEPQLDMREVVVAAEAGFRLVAVEELETNSQIKLERWGKIKGMVHRAAGVSTNEDLDLAWQGNHVLGLQLHTRTDDQGRFEFDRVPPGLLQVNGRNNIGQNGWTWDPLEKVTLKPGGELDLDIHAATKTEHPAGFRPASPIAKTIRRAGPGPQGIVLLPNGKPAADAEVALLMPGKYIALGRGTLKAFEARQEGLALRAGSDGHFALPSIEGATGVVAVHDGGFALVSLEQMKNPAQIQLEAWGVIEGTLRIGQRLGTNELVVLESANRFNDDSHLFFDAQDFQARTDEQGKFVITFVPPGQRRIARLIPMQGRRGWQHSAPTVVVVKSGTTTSVVVGGTGRTLMGKLKVEGRTVNWENVQASIHTHLPASFQQQRTPEEQVKWSTSPEAKEAMEAYRVYPVSFVADGSFKAEEVTPGTYQFDVTILSGPWPPQGPSDFVGHLRRELVVPEPSGTDDSAPLNLGTLESTFEPDQKRADVAR